MGGQLGLPPHHAEEADTLAETLKPIIDPGLVRFAFFDGEPVAVLGGFPDPNWALRPRWKWYGDWDTVRHRAAAARCVGTSPGSG